jgi:hypothetical protein
MLASARVANVQKDRVPATLVSTDTEEADQALYKRQGTVKSALMSPCLFVTVIVSSSLVGCAPTLVSGSMTNPAKTSELLQSTQEYDIGPYKENHRYTVSIKKWTPASVAAEIKLVDDASCADASNYEIALVDDKGARYRFVPAGEPQRASEHGRNDVALTATTLAGQFDAPISANTTAMTIELHAVKGVDCPKLDFRWDLK